MGPYLNDRGIDERKDTTKTRRERSTKLVPILIDNMSIRTPLIYF